MELEINERIDNLLLKREEILFEAHHPGAPTPTRGEVLEKLCGELGVSEDLVVIEKLATPHGRQTASGIARVYESKDNLEEYEAGYLVTRTEKSKEKSEEEQQEGAAEEEEETPEEENPEGEEDEESSNDEESEESDKKE